MIHQHEFRNPAGVLDNPARAVGRCGIAAAQWLEVFDPRGSMKDPKRPSPSTAVHWRRCGLPHPSCVLVDIPSNSPLLFARSIGICRRRRGPVALRPSGAGLCSHVSPPSNLLSADLTQSPWLPGWPGLNPLPHNRLTRLDRILLFRRAHDSSSPLAHYRDSHPSYPCSREEIEPLVERALDIDRGACTAERSGGGHLPPFVMATVPPDGRTSGKVRPPPPY